MSTASRKETGADVLCWSVHPARERLAAALSALAVVISMSLLCGALMESLWWAVLAFVIQFFALRRFFLPSRFRIDAVGVTARTAGLERHFRWEEIRRFLCDARGGFLSTRRHNSPLDLFRGMHLIFGENRDAVISSIQSRLGGERPA